MNKTFYVCQRHHIKIEFSCYFLCFAHSISMVVFAWLAQWLLGVMYQPKSMRKKNTNTFHFICDTFIYFVFIFIFCCGHNHQYTHHFASGFKPLPAPCHGGIRLKIHNIRIVYDSAPMFIPIRKKKNRANK